MITEEEIRLALHSLERARLEGAQKARVSLSKSTEDLVATLDGEVDRVTHCADRSLNIYLFVDGRFGTFSTNKIDEQSLDSFIRRAVEAVRMLAPDGFRDLPKKERCCTEAVDGKEMGLWDSSYPDMTPESRIRTALDACIFGKVKGEGYTVISEEGEYSDSEYDLFVADTEGLKCRHLETNFDYGVEVTIEDGNGEKYSDYWWTSSPFLKDFDPSGCGSTAVGKAASRIGSIPAESGKYNMVVSSDIASRMVSPLLSALNAYSVQQGNSFLTDSLGKKMFHEGMTIMDKPHIKGQGGSKLFDSEGVATRERAIIENGVVKQFFVNTYMAGKMGMEPTVEDATRPAVMPWPRKGLDCKAIMEMCGDGILVTEFNGGNCNSATGDFSYGICGQQFREGKVSGPVSEMLVTGNFISLWNSLVAAGDDARPCMSKLVPTLAFANVDFNG